MAAATITVPVQENLVEDVENCEDLDTEIWKKRSVHASFELKVVLMPKYCPADLQLRSSS